MHRSSCLAIAILGLMLFASSAVAAESIQSIPVRPDITLSYYLKTPEEKNGKLLILFTRGGGEGNFKKSESGVEFSNDFLMRSIDRFIAAGFAVAAVGLPNNLEFMDNDFRFSEVHYQDVTKLCDKLAKDGYQSIYLISTGSGSLSVVPIANRKLPSQVKGVVLTNAFDVSRAPTPVPAADKVKLPVLMIHHEADTCRKFPIEGAMKIRDALAQTTKVNLVRVYGGMKSEGHECDSMGPHGFLGVEDAVVRTVVDWIAGKPIPERISDRK